MKAKFKVGSKVKILRKPQMKSVVKTVDRVAPREYMYTVEDTYPTWYRECELELAKEAK